MSETNETELLPELEEQIRSFEGRGVNLLRFPAELEARYRTETVASRAHMLLVQGLVALLAYDFFIVGDYLMAPEYILRSLLTRFAVVTPLVLLASLILKSRRNTLLLESVAALLCVAGSISVLYMHHGVSASVSAGAQTGLMLVLLVANCMLRIELPFAAAISLVTLLLDAASLYFDRELGLSQKMFSGGVLVWVAFLTLTANYTLTRERRYSYLLQLRGRLQRGLLAGINAELLALSSTDRLTGLPNRRAYDDRLAELWRVTAERGEPISAVMVDVDYFKRLNDTHGHPYGDKILQRVASLLQQALRAEDDFVARFGGEEFVVLLPNTGAEGALKVAERMRTLVQVAGSPAVQRDAPLLSTDVWTTVSCGVATAWPASMQDSSHLIVAADAALYRAKREGRNRSCCAPAAARSAEIVMFPIAGLA